MRKKRQFRVASFAHTLVAGILMAALAGCGSGEEDDSAVLIIESEPEQGASVIIGGRVRGVTPLTLRGMTAGQYYATLSQYGYKRKSQTINLPETGEVRIVARMQPIVGYLTLESDPPRAQVYLNGVEYLGETPLVTRAIPIGAYTYELRQENYVTLESQVEILEDRRYSFTHLLTHDFHRVPMVSSPIYVVLAWGAYR